MAFTLFIIGALLLIAAIRNTQGDLFALVQGDFTGPRNFVYWTVSILVVGSLGYIPKFRPFANMFLALIIIALFLNKQGQLSATGVQFFNSITSQLKSTQTPAAPATSQTPATGSLSLPGLPDLGKLIPQFNF